MTVAMAATDLDSRLAGVARQYDDVQAELALPETSRTPTRSAGSVASSPASSRSSPRSAVESTRGELAGARELRDASDGDDELRQMAPTRSPG